MSKLDFNGMMEGMQKIGILGFGREGQALLRFLRRSPKFRGSEIWVLDQNRGIRLPTGIRARLGPDYLKDLSEFDLLFRSPGCPYMLPEIQRALKGGTKVSSATKLFFEEAGRRGIKNIIGVTGTKGKGTTSTLIYKILKAGGRKVFLAGNIGTPALDLLTSRSPLSASACVILELSSFQLQDMETSPPIAVVLDIFPDHQDAHKNLSEYYGAKANISRHQRKSDITFFFSGNRKSAWIAKQGNGKKIPVTEKGFKTFEPAELKIPGMHNFKNAVMAAAVARSLGIRSSVIAQVAKSFKGNEHRLEFVRRIMIRQARHTNKSAIYFYNDSASTNPHTTAAALRSFPGENKILIAGGRSKVHDYGPVRQALDKETKLVILIGENKKEMARALQRKGGAIVFAKTLQEAVSRALREAKALTHNSLFSIRARPKVCVLFSPGSSSFDMFHDYASRGKQFKKLVKKL